VKLPCFRPSVHPIRPPLLRVCCCGPGGQEISIDCCTADGQQQPRRSDAGSATLSADVTVTVTESFLLRPVLKTASQNNHQSVSRCLCADYSKTVFC